VTAHELHTWLRALHAVAEPSVDRVIVGDPGTVVRGAAVVPWEPAAGELTRELVAMVVLRESG